MSFLGRFFHAAPHEEEKSGMSSDPHISENTQDHHSSELGLFAGLSISSPAILQPPLREEKRQEKHDAVNVQESEMPETNDEQSAFGFIDEDIPVQQEHSPSMEPIMISKSDLDHETSLDVESEGDSELQGAPLNESKEQDMITNNSLEEIIYKLSLQVRKGTEEVEEVLSMLWDDIDSLDEKSKETNDAIVLKSSIIEDCHQRIAQLEESQTDLVEKEDFDGAALLDHEIEEARKQIVVAKSQIQELHLKLKLIEENRPSLVSDALKQIHLLSVNGERGALGTDSSLKLLVNREIEEITVEEDSLIGQMDRAEQVLEHIQSDLAKVCEEEKEIYNKVKQQTVEIHEEREILLSSKNLLEMERDDLLQKLKEKESEIATLDGKIDIVNSEIDKASQIYARDLRRLKETKQNIVKDQDSQKEEFNQLQLRKQALEQKKKICSLRENEFDSLTVKLEHQSAFLNGVAERLTRFHARQMELKEVDVERSCAIKESETLKKDAFQKQCTAEAKIRQITGKLAKLLNDRTKIREQSRILDLSKVEAVRRREFKKAGAIVRELKELSNRLEEFVDSENQLEQELKILRDSLTELHSEFSEIDSRLPLMKERYDKKVLWTLIDHSKQVEYDLHVSMKERNTSSLEQEKLKKELVRLQDQITFICADYGWDAAEFDNTEPKKQKHFEEGVEEDSISAVSVIDNLTEEKAELQNLLEKALALEEYDEAARLHDLIETQERDVAEGQIILDKLEYIEAEKNEEVSKEELTELFQRQSLELNEMQLRIEDLRILLESAISEEQFEEAEDLQREIDISHSYFSYVSSGLHRMKNVITELLSELEKCAEEE